MPASKAKMKAIAKYEQKAYDKILLRLPKGTGDKIKAAAGDGGSVNGFIREAVEARLKGDTPKPTPTTAAENAAETPQEAAGAILEGGAVCLPSEEEKRAQNAPEAENGRTACSVKSDIYEAAAVAAGKKSVSINDFVDKWVKIGADETEKNYQIKREHEQALADREAKGSPIPCPEKENGRAKARVCVARRRNADKLGGNIRAGGLEQAQK
jgi:predicted HicB family RNase H-like nuclease